MQFPSEYPKTNKGFQCFINVNFDELVIEGVKDVINMEIPEQLVHEALQEKLGEEIRDFEPELDQASVECSRVFAAMLYYYALKALKKHFHHN